MLFQASGALEVTEKQKKELEVLKKMDFSRYSIKGTEDDWSEALKNGGAGKGSVYVKR